MYLTIIIPVFNEIKTIEILLNKVFQIEEFKKQIIVVDDCSTDGTKNILIKYYNDKKINTLIFHKKNLGKGAAIKTASTHILGDVVIIQDADLEYSPSDYFKIVNPIFRGEKEVVYGSRVLGKSEHMNFTSNFRVLANYFLTCLTNVLYQQKLTDAHTCYKAFKSSLFAKLKLKENDFAFCPEVTALISKMNIIIHEVPINYNGRDYDEGKKISFIDGFKAIYVLLKNRLI
jgi:dolichol-phosphate mannosyltransferase